MICPQCQFENREDAKFCKECGYNLELACSGCGTVYESGSKFCDECGYTLKHDPQINKTEPTSDGERKHVTVLFSDLSGYTAMSEKLDPEEVKEITGRLFDDISKIVSKYDGFIEKYAGDAVMALFGADHSHEDDPVRAVKAAHEIHGLVESISPRYEDTVGQPLQMHSGINTGLVVTGELNLEKGIHGVAGDTINVAARMSSVAGAGEILVDHETYNRTEGYFQFENLDPVQLKGKTNTVQIHRYLAVKDQPQKIHRLHGLRAELIGRKAEIAELSEAVENLSQGKGSVFSIVGAPGTGKSRLVEEFKASLDLSKIQWREGHAFPYAQNIPYFPLMDLISKAIQIDEGDSPETVKEKIESSIELLIGKTQGIAPYIGSLYALDYPEIDEVSPEFWKAELQKAILMVLTALAQRAPTVVCLEDLHWADPSTIELVHFLLSEIRYPALFLCVYRPTISPFSTHQTKAMAIPHQELHLRDLSLSESQNMVESLLKTDTLPKDLQRFIKNRVEGNPFYLEEAINSLIELNVLVSENGDWQVSGRITESEISATIQGVISARVDRLEQESKRILQEASVIGRSFFYDILKRISEIKDNIDRNLSVLERFDLIKTKSIQPYLEYIFKHALTQEVVYNGLLKKERRKIHEQIGQVIEELFKDRLAEFYETLAFHFARGQSVTKAVDYLLKSGEKCLARYTVEEAHKYFREAYDILASKEELSEAEKIILIDILNSWGYAYYYLCEIKEFVDIFSSHQGLANSLEDKARAGMFYVWLGVAHFMAGKSKVSYEYLCKGLELGEKVGNQKVVGYACTWLPWTCCELGLFAEGIGYGERAQKIAESFPSDQYLFFKSLGGLCFIYFFMGNTSKIFEGAKRLLEYGEINANSRCNVFGHWMKAFAHWSAGDMKSSQKSSEKAIEVSMDPAYSQFPKFTLGMTYFLGGKLQKAEDVLQSVIKFSEKHGEGEMSAICQYILAPILIAKGQMKQGTELMEKTRKTLLRNQRRVQYALSEYILGEVNLQIATGPKPTLSVMAKNIGFLVKNVPFASKKAEEHFIKAIELLKEIGVKGYLGLSYLSLGLLYKSSKRTDQAKQCILKAIDLFEECEAEVFLKQANDVLDSLG